MTAAPRPAGRFGFLLPNASAAGVPESRAGLLVASKIESLQQSCERVRVEAREAVSWSELLDDFAALNASLRLLRDSIPAHFNALAITPHEVPTDLSVVGSLPELLITSPDDEAYNIADVLVLDLKRRGLVFDSPSSTGSSSTSSTLLTTLDAPQLRLKVQTFNRQLDHAREVLQQNASEFKKITAEVSKVATHTQPSQPKAAILRKEYEILYSILTRIYRGTSLAPTPQDI